MKSRLVLVGILCSLIVLATGGTVLAAPQQVDGPNLLVNPGFESPYVKQCCHDEPEFFPGTPIDEVQVATGWSGWWLVPDRDPLHPGNCENLPRPCTAWHRPEWREANCGAACANRIHTGNNAQKYFTFWSVHDAGMFQQVSGIRVGSNLRFSVYMQGWSTNANYGLSDRGQNMGMRVGIDPTGGTNGFSPNIIWSAPNDVWDEWGLYQIEAVARSTTVTVFTRSTPVYGVQHNDVYVDDASLVVVGASSPVVVPAQSSSGGVAPSATTIEGTGDGPVYYVVQAGDNLYRISRRYGTTVDRLKQLNNLTGLNPIIKVGQRLLIAP